MYGPKYVKEVEKIGDGSFTIQFISTAVRNIIINIHFFIVLQITDIISTDSAPRGNSPIINYFNEYIKYQTYHERHLAFINKLYYSDQFVKKADFHRIGFVTKPGIYHRVVIDFASFDFMEKIEVQQRYNLDSVLRDRIWYTKCVPQIISSFLDDITFRENIPCRKAKDFVGFCKNNYQYLGIN